MGSTYGALTNIMLFGSVAAYFVVSDKSRLALPFIALGLIFFSLSGFNYSGVTSDYLKDFIRFFLFIFCINQLCRETSSKELLIFLIIGSFSILINTVFFSNAYGRYSGFYINPNKAGFICLFGFALTYSIKKYKLKLVAQLVFVVCGILTLSRSFILFLVIINIFSLFADKKNIQTMLIGLVAFVIILTAGSLQLNKDRFSALQSIFNDDSIKTNTITKGSRDETWSDYSEVIYDNLIFGAGYKSMRGGSESTTISHGVHNTFLMVLGEAGFVAFLIIVIIYSMLFSKSLSIFKLQQEYTFLSIAIFGYLMVAHNYFDKYDVLFVSIWLYNQLLDNSNQKLELEKEL